MSMLVEEPGLFTTIQDHGRPGYRKWGVPESGAADRTSMTTANTIAGNDPAVPVLEFTGNGGRYRFEKDTVIAIAGADMQPEVNGTKVTMYRKIYLRRGDLLSVLTAVSGYRSYLAVEGGFECELQMGSASTYTPAAIGGHNGRCLRAGDCLRWRGRLENSTVTFSAADTNKKITEPVQTPGQIMLTAHAGPEWHLMPDETKQAFCKTEYVVTGRSDRMAIHLKTPHPLRSISGIVSSPLMPGVIQLPVNGYPVILHRDAQTVGGYPRIAVVEEPLLNKLAQARPGTVVRIVMKA